MPDIRPFKSNEEPTFHCPKCGAKLGLVIWGGGWDWDYTGEPCSECGYEGELDTMTGFDPDGSVWQDNKKNHKVY